MLNNENNFFLFSSNSGMTINKMPTQYNVFDDNVFAWIWPCGLLSLGLETVLA